MIRHTSKVKDEVGLQKIEEKDKQFLIEKIISNIEKKTCEIEVEKKPDIMLQIDIMLETIGSAYIKICLLKLQIHLCSI